MRKRFFVLMFLASLFAFLLYLFSPIPVLQIQTELGALIDCSPISVGDEVIYHSINSIYRVPVEERLRVLGDGALVPVSVISSPAVVYYYGIEAFERIDDAQVRAVPRETRYREVRIKVGAPGQQRIVVRGQEIAPSDWVEPGQSVIVSVRAVPRVQRHKICE